MKRAKKILVLFIVAVYAIVNAYSVEIDGIYYTLQAATQTAFVTGAPQKDYTGEVVIPESVTYKDKEYKVTAIGINAFRSNLSVTMVVIPASVDSIASYAFYGATALQEIVMENSVKVIENNAFGYASKLEKINLSSELVFIQGVVESSKENLSQLLGNQGNGNDILQLGCN